MKRKIFFFIFVSIALTTVMGLVSVFAQNPNPLLPNTAQGGLGDAFTYQGQLNESNNPATGIYDFKFELYDSLIDGSQVGDTVTQSVAVNDGLFTVILDFGTGVFRGDAHYLEISVRPSSSGDYTTLTPRQPLTAAPYASVSRSVYNSDALAEDVISIEGGNTHIKDGDIWLTNSEEHALIMRQTNLANSPTFSLGRIITGGDGSPEFRVLYSDLATAERSVFEFDNKGIVASVKPELGSHFEGFLVGDVEPLFRLNSYPTMQLEFGSGGATPTDVIIRRVMTGTLAFLTGGVEQVRIDSAGNVGIGTSITHSKLHIVAGNNQLILENNNGEADGHKWLFSTFVSIDDNLLKLMTANDAFTSWDEAIVIERSGVDVTNVSFPSSYVQLDTVAGSPPPSDCAGAGDYGKMKVDPAGNGTLWICVENGWQAK